MTSLRDLLNRARWRDAGLHALEVHVLSDGAELWSKTGGERGAAAVVAARAPVETEERTEIVSTLPVVLAEGTSETPLVIDGSAGEGGGQILRTALALSMATRTPFVIENIGSPTEETYALADAVLASQAPAARDFVRKEVTAEYVYEGLYGPTPIYQAGTAPFASPADGGGLVLEGGKPKAQGAVDLRFALAVPDAQKCPPPAAGYPIVLYAHGTTGDYRSFVGDGTARALAQRCLASMGIDQVLHGTRLGAPPLDDPARDSKIQLYFFNFENPLAARTNNRQAAADVVQQARLFTESKTTVPAAVSTTGAEIAFDGSKVLFFGHSQGGLNGPLFLAASKLSRGGVLSGAGGVFGITLMEKTKPVDIPAAVRFLVRLGGEERAKELDLFHPIITLTQSMIDVSDPINYGADLVREPRPGFVPKSIYQTEGIAADGTGDTYTPTNGIEALALSIGLPRLSPGVRPIPEAAWLGLSANLVAASGRRATGALAQFVPPAGRDGHFVVFDVPEAQAQAARFCEALAADPVGRITP